MHSSLDRLMKPALYFSAVYNAFGALSFAFPEAVSRFAQVPTAGHPFYQAFTVMTIAVFGAGYAAQAFSGQRDRTFLAAAAAGKLAFFFIHFVLWLRGDSPPVAVGAASGDLMLGSLFVLWLATTPANKAAAAAPASQKASS